MRFEGKTVAITGGGSGIGKETASRFVAEGASVAINGRDEAKLSQAAKEIDPTGTGAQVVLTAMRQRWPWIKHLFADGAYDRRQLLDSAAFLEFVVEIVRRSDKEFKILP